MTLDELDDLPEGPTLSHGLLIARDPEEVRRLCRQLARPGRLHVRTVLHADDGGCCKRESWRTTLQTIADAHGLGTALPPEEVDGPDWLDGPAGRFLHPDGERGATPPEQKGGVIGSL